MIALILAFLLPTQTAHITETTTATTVDGRTVQVQINFPENPPGLAPVVVLAPGQCYHMNLPLLQEMAEALAAEGYITYRFNWNYFTSNPPTKPSDDLETEVLDMQAVTALAKADPRVDHHHMYILGKSLGSMVAHRAFQRDPFFRAAALLTPVCTSRYDQNDNPLPAPVPAAEENYPGVKAETRPVMFATSDRDPNCDLAMLEEFVRDTKIPVTVVGGNHSWDVTKGEDEAGRALNRQNRALGISLVLNWLKGQW